MEDCSDAFNVFSEQHQLVVDYDWPDGKDPPPTHSFSLRSAWLEGRYVHITDELWQEGQAVLADKLELCRCVPTGLLLLLLLVDKH